MEIAGYIVPDKKKNNKFLHSLKQQYDKKGKLTQKQWEALEDNLGIIKDFYYWDKLPDWDLDFQNDFDHIEWEWE